jgi:hypothetical protein
MLVWHSRPRLWNQSPVGAECESPGRRAGPPTRACFCARWGALDSGVRMKQELPTSLPQVRGPQQRPMLPLMGWRPSAQRQRSAISKMRCFLLGSSTRASLAAQ